MNGPTDEADSAREILYLSFNQTSTALSVGSKNGYMLYDLDQVHECQPTYESSKCFSRCSLLRYKYCEPVRYTTGSKTGNIEDVCIIERNFSTSLVAYVSLHSPRNLVLYNYNKGTEILEKLFPNTVLSVKLNRKNVVVCLEDKIYILYIMGLKDEKLHAITNTPPNIKGLITLTYGNGNSLLAYPGSCVNGNVQIFDATERHAKTTIPAHTSPLAALAFDEDGEKLATASIKGTVIRVFSVVRSQILFEFRRGVKRCVEIQSLSFNIGSEFLCASSNTETVHIFKLSADEETVENIDEEGWMEMFGRVLTQSAKYLPTQMSDVLTQQRAFATVHLPSIGQKTVSAITKIQNINYVMIASLEGFLYIYELNTEAGGPCHLVKQHRLEGPLMPFMTPFSSAITPHYLPSKTVEEDAKSSLGLENDPTPCVESNVIEPHNEDHIIKTVCASNGIHAVCDELPPLLNKVE